MRLSGFFIFSFFIVFGFWMTSCEDDYTDADQIPPAEVHGLNILHGEHEVSLSWKDPRNYDFRNVRVECCDSAYVIDKGIEHVDILNLKNDTTYTIFIKSVDYSGNKSPGTRVLGKPRSLPHLIWEPTALLKMEYSPNGYPNGRFYIQRHFKNSGNAGYISFLIYTINLETLDTLNSSRKVLLLQANTDYLFNYYGKGDLSVFNCSDCDTSNFSHQISIISELDQETFYANPINCQQLSGCANGINTRSIRWNSIVTRDVYLEKIERSSE